MALWDKCEKCGKLVIQPHDCDEDELDDLEEDAIKRKKKGIRYGGKHKGRGKEKRRMP